MASKERRQSTKSKKKCARSDSSTKYPPLDSDKIQRALPRVPSEKQRGGYQFLLPNKLKVKKCTSEPKNARKLSSSEYRPASSDSDENYETLNPELMIQVMLSNVVHERRSIKCVFERMILSRPIVVLVR